MAMESKTYRTGRPVHPHTTAAHMRAAMDARPGPRCAALVRRQWFHDAAAPRCPRRGTECIHGTLYCVQHAQIVRRKLKKEAWPWPVRPPE